MSTSLNTAAPFQSINAEPHELAKLCAAFDVAWRGVISVDTVGATSQKRARKRMAKIILELWRDNPDQALAARAIERFHAAEPALPAPMDMA